MQRSILASLLPLYSELLTMGIGLGILALLGFVWFIALKPLEAVDWAILVLCMLVILVAVYLVGESGTHAAF